MKKKILGILTPILAGVTLIGTGFSVWYFTDSTSTEKSLNVTVTLADYVTIGSLETSPKYDNYELRFDSTKVSGENSGIHLYGKTSASDFTLADDINLTYTYGTSESNGERPTLKLTVTVPGVANKQGNPSSLADYLDINLASTNWTNQTSSTESGNTVYEYSVSTSSSTLDQNGTITINMPAFQFLYKEGMEPENADEWETLNNILNNTDDVGANTVTFDYELVFEA